MATSPAQGGSTIRGCARCRRNSWRVTKHRRTQERVMTPEIADGVPPDNPGCREIGFSIPARYNASRILFDNLARGHGERLALTGPAGTRSYAELCADASRWGHGFRSLELKRGDRILMLLDDT